MQTLAKILVLAGAWPLLLVLGPTYAASAAPPLIESPAWPGPASRQPRPAPEDVGESGLEADLERLRTLRREREEKAAPRPPTWGERLTRSLKRDQSRPYPRVVMIEASAILAYGLTQPPARDYGTSPSSFFQIFWRPRKNPNPSGLNFLTGFRLAPISGSGYFKARPLRYGYTYFGPMIGLGRFALREPGGAYPLDKATSSTVGASHDGPDPGVGTGWILTSGIAAMHRMRESEFDEPSTPESDQSSSPVIVDGTGLWLEGRYLWLRSGAFHLSALAGVQTGTYHHFVYVGAGFGGWL